GPGQGRRQKPGQEPGRRGVSVMQLVPHLQGAGHEGPQLDAPQVGHCCLKSPEKAGTHPPQAVEDLRRVGSEAQDLAKAFVVVAECPSAGCRVLDYPEGHRWADDPGHGADSVVMMAWLEMDLPGSQRSLGGCGGR